jgi:hypothetical protein
LNTAEGKITFSQDLLEFDSINKKGGIFTFWTNGPDINGEIVEFGGGMPSPGYTGTSGKLFTITFKVKAKASGKAKVSVATGRMLANDGRGTDMRPTLGSAEIVIGGASGTGNTGTGGTSGQSGSSPTPTPTKKLGPNGEVLAENDENRPKEEIDDSLPTPEVNEYHKEITKKEKYFWVKGTSKFPNCEVVITVTQDGFERKRYFTHTDKEGNFEYTAPNTWNPGKYKFWVEAVNEKGKYSPKSQEYEFEIKENKAEKIAMTAADFVPIFILFIAFIALIVQLVRNILRNKRMNKHLEQAAVEVRLEREQKEKGGAALPGDVQQKPEADPRMKDK